MANTYHRQRYALLTDTGTAVTSKGDTGPATWGELVQVLITGRNWSDSGDTGMAIRIAVVPQQGEDTGIGFDIVDVEDIRLSSAFAPVQRIRLGGDTGTSDTGFAPFVLSGDHLRVKATAGTTRSDSGLEVLIYAYFKT